MLLPKHIYLVVKEMKWKKEKGKAVAERNVTQKVWQAVLGGLKGGFWWWRGEGPGAVMSAGLWTAKRNNELWYSTCTVKLAGEAECGGGMAVIVVMDANGFYRCRERGESLTGNLVG